MAQPAWLGDFVAYYLRLGAVGFGGPIVDVATAVIALAALVILVRLKKVPEAAVMVAAGLAGRWLQGG